MEAETNEDSYVPPDLVRNSPGVAKVWLQYEQTGAHSLLASYNMTSVTDGDATGDSDIVIATDFSSAQYVVVGSGELAGAVFGYSIATQAAGTITLLTTNHAGTAVDSESTCAMFGDQ